MKNFLKKVLMWLQKSPPKYKIVICFWEDILSSCSWENLETIKQSHPAICWSVGYLVKKDHEVTIITSDLTVEEKNGNYVIEEGGNTTTIPTKNVLKMYEIPLEYKL